MAVKKKGTELAGSPFKIMVSPAEVGDASKVKVAGATLTAGKTHHDNKFTIDTKSAGKQDAGVGSTGSELGQY